MPVRMEDIALGRCYVTSTYSGPQGAFYQWRERQVCVARKQKFHRLGAEWISSDEYPRSVRARMWIEG
jgi:hypothetical protein